MRQRCILGPMGMTSLLLGLLVTILQGPVHADTPERLLRIYLDADRTHSYASARAIEMGVSAALSQEELHPEGVRFEIVPKDHRGNVKRSFRNLLEYHRDPDGLVVFGGMHSPPYLAYHDEINANGMLMLLPWSAAGPLTRTSAPVNWIFRASVDDTKAGGFLVHQAVEQADCTSITSVLLNNGWGRMNEKAISKALSRTSLPAATTFFFDRGITEAGMRILTRDILATGAECVILVGDAASGAMLIREFAEAEQSVRILSHWGITGGNLVEHTTLQQRDNVDLQFIQTCLPFGERSGEVVLRADEAARRLFPEDFETLSRLSAPVGFAHGYDLGLLLLAALQQTGTNGEIEEVRARVRHALEALDEPVHGVMKTYVAPFAPGGFDAHEALGADDLCLARYNAQGHVVFDTVAGPTTD